MLDPYVHPLEELAFLTPPILSGRSDRARKTIIELDLNRADLIEDRTEHIKELSRALEAIDREDGELRDLLISQMERELDLGNIEYISMKRALLEAYKQLN